MQLGQNCIQLVGGEEEMAEEMEAMEEEIGRILGRRWRRSHSLGWGKRSFNPISGSSPRPCALVW